MDIDGFDNLEEVKRSQAPSRVSIFLPKFSKPVLRSEQPPEKNEPLQLKKRENWREYTASDDYHTKDRTFSIEWRCEYLESIYLYITIVWVDFYKFS